VLSAETGQGSRALVSCSRCGLLRFLGDAPRLAGSRFSEFVSRHGFVRNAAERLLGAVRRGAARGPMRFVRGPLKANGAAKPILQVGGVDGSILRDQGFHQADCLLMTPQLEVATHALHREGIPSLVADSASPPLRLGALHAVLRLRGFSGEADPAAWLTSIARKLQPGGRVVLQVFDCSSWGFLLCGSRWVGLEPESAFYAFRAEDLDVLIELCGMRVVRRSHFFPLLNTLVWTSSLFPSLDVVTASSAEATNPSTMRILLYLAVALLLWPLALVESVCQTGSVLMLEAECKV